MTSCKLEPARSAPAGVTARRADVRQRIPFFARVFLSYFDRAPGFAGAVAGAVAGEPAPDPVVVDGFVELVLVVGALVWFDAVW